MPAEHDWCSLPHYSPHLGRLHHNPGTSALVPGLPVMPPGKASAQKTPEGVGVSAASEMTHLGNAAAHLCTLQLTHGCAWALLNVSSGGFSPCAIMSSTWGPNHLHVFSNDACCRPCKPLKAHSLCREWSTHASGPGCT